MIFILQIVPWSLKQKDDEYYQAITKAYWGNFYQTFAYT